MTWLQSIDTALFHWINQSLANPVFDWLMPKLAAHPLFVPLLLVIGILLLWKGGRRGRVLVLFLAIVLICGDSFVCKTMKQAVGRVRPCAALPDVRLLVGCGPSGSMPSSHAANWFAAAMVMFIFYRRSWRVMLPAAATVAFSRVYNGVHYPSDVLVGAVLGAGYAAAGVWSGDALWRWAGRKWFPLWWEKLPSLMFPAQKASPQFAEDSAAADVMRNRQWLRLGYLVIGALLLFRLGYVASSVIELSKDEAYQWLWSKHLALSYYSKPLGIAVIQFVGTSLWGDTQLGVRFFSPVFAAILSVALLRFMAREVGARPAFVLVLILTATPLMGVGTVLMTIDPPLVLCWTLAMIVGWRAVQPEGRTRDWMLVGLATGLGFLCKYSAAYLILCWAFLFVLWPPARVHLRRPGPYVALLVLGLCTLPVIIWNARHGWITATHVSENASLGQNWQPTLRYFWDFSFVEAALLNPIFFVGALWAMAAFWRRRKEKPLWLYFFCMGAPVFLGHWLYSLHSRILPNWIAPAVVPMFCLMAAYWHVRWKEGARWVKPALVTGLVFGFLAVTLMHQSNFIGKIVGRPLPGERDPLRRVRAWKETAAAVEQARQELLQKEGRPAFIIADHYGMTGLFTFYLPAAKAAAGMGRPLVYCEMGDKPDNQLFFWPEYRYRRYRTGENAICAVELRPYPLEDDWWWKWLTGKEVRYAEVPPPPAVPSWLRDQFESVTDLGQREIKLRDRVFRRIWLYECRHLR